MLRRWVSCMRTTEGYIGGLWADADISKRYHFTRAAAERRGLVIELLIWREGSSGYLTSVVRKRVETDY